MYHSTKTMIPNYRMCNVPCDMAPKRWSGSICRAMGRSFPACVNQECTQSGKMEGIGVQSDWPKVTEGERMAMMSLNGAIRHQEEELL